MASERWLEDLSDWLTEPTVSVSGTFLTKKKNWGLERWKSHHTLKGAKTDLSLGESRSQVQVLQDVVLWFLTDRGNRFRVIGSYELCCPTLKYQPQVLFCFYLGFYFCYFLQFSCHQLFILLQMWLTLPVFPLNLLSFVISFKNALL